jgi:hypothetical protein
MKENLRPEEQLKEARERARRLLDLEGMSGKKDEMQRARQPVDHLLSADRLSLFLRSLNAELLSALREARASSEQLTELAAELRSATAHREPPQ